VLHAGGGVSEDVIAGGQSAGDSEGGEREACEGGGLDGLLSLVREGERGAGVEGGAQLGVAGREQRGERNCGAGERGAVVLAGEDEQGCCAAV